MHIICRKFDDPWFIFSLDEIVYNNPKETEVKLLFGRLGGGIPLIWYIHSRLSCIVLFSKLAELFTITFHSQLVTGFFNHMFHEQLHYSTCFECWHSFLDHKVLGKKVFTPLFRHNCCLTILISKATYIPHLKGWISSSQEKWHLV